MSSILREEGLRCAVLLLQQLRWCARVASPPPPPRFDAVSLWAAGLLQWLSQEVAAPLGVAWEAGGSRCGRTHAAVT